MIFINQFREKLIKVFDFLHYDENVKKNSKLRTNKLFSKNNLINQQKIILLIKNYSLIFLFSFLAIYFSNENKLFVINEKTIGPFEKLLDYLKLKTDSRIIQNFDETIENRKHYYSYDKPVRGLTSDSDSGTVNVENSNEVNRWFKRLIKGDSYFEIPDYPLDKQPDPNKITHIDSDLRYCSSEIKDQNSCGACYAFSWNSLAEWHYCRQLNGTKQIDFSEQHIVDCGHKTKLKGCIEGLLKNVRAFSQIYGFELEDNYPWKKKENKCKNVDGSIDVKTEMIRVKVDRQEWEQILKEQPILLEVHLPDDISSYSRGVHPGNNCNKDLGHGMILVGYGRQEGVPYWLLKNSMGKKWGENGYLRLSRDAPMKECFATGFILKFKFKSLPEENYDDFYGNIKFNPTVQAEETILVDNTLSKLL